MLIGRIVIPGILIAISWILIASRTLACSTSDAAAHRRPQCRDIYSFWACLGAGARMCPSSPAALASFQAMDPRLEEASDHDRRRQLAQTLRSAHLAAARYARGRAAPAPSVVHRDLLTFSMLRAGARGHVPSPDPRFFYDTVAHARIDWRWGVGRT